MVTSTLLRLGRAPAAGLALALVAGCASTQTPRSAPHVEATRAEVDPSKVDPPEAKQVPLVELARAEVDTLNADLRPGPLTMDVAILIPSNLDPGFDRVSVEQLLDGIRSAKEIFAAVDVQLALRWVKTGPLDPRYLSISYTETPKRPPAKDLAFYRRMQRYPRQLSEEALAAFDSFVPKEPNNARTIYLVVLQDVFYPYFEATESGDFALRITPTSGLSFPPYMLGSEIPRRLRGVIAISNLTKGANRFKTIAHEIGHKTINVSHEYRTIAPEFEVVGEGGLMIYGAGTEIPSGEEGRWHRERLERSPFLYRFDASGHRTWNADYEDGGHYFDPIYGDKVIHAQ